MALRALQQVAIETGDAEVGAGKARDRSSIQSEELFERESYAHRRGLGETSWSNDWRPTTVYVALHL